MSRQAPLYKSVAFLSLQVPKVQSNSSGWRRNRPVDSTHQFKYTGEQYQQSSRLHWSPWEADYPGHVLQSIGAFTARAGTVSEAQLRGLAAQQVGWFTRVHGTAYQPCQIGTAVWWFPHWKGRNSMILWSFSDTIVWCPAPFPNPWPIVFS